MDYAEIKRNLSEAARMVDSGNLSDADARIRSLLGQGLTGADLQANLGPERVRKLREYSQNK